jgi:hypothetical protein
MSNDDMDGVGALFLFAWRLAGHSQSEAFLSLAANV